MFGRDTAPSDLLRPWETLRPSPRLEWSPALRPPSSSSANVRNICCTPMSCWRFASIFAWYPAIAVPVRPSRRKALKQRSKSICSMKYAWRSMTLMPLILFRLPNDLNLLSEPLMISARAASFLASSQTDVQARKQGVRPSNEFDIMFMTWRAFVDCFLRLSSTAFLAFCSLSARFLSLFSSSTFCLMPPKIAATRAMSLARPMRSMILFVASFWESLHRPSLVLRASSLSAASVSALMICGSFLQRPKTSDTSLPSMSSALRERTPRAFLSCSALYSESALSERSMRSAYSSWIDLSSFIWRQWCSQPLNVMPTRALLCPPQSEMSTFWVL
mmetsp:Transcript_73651/g.193232  ORF Transcript_73651/g.193232 Transcript_73651/m.193232 type:complete len:332 (+) Transcript_73651:484-1479(+)